MPFENQRFDFLDYEKQVLKGAVGILL